MLLSLLDLLHRTAEWPFLLPASAPSMQVADRGDALHLRLELPGIDPRSVQVKVGEQSVWISGYGTREERTEGPNFAWVQAGMQSFYRELPLPAPVDPNRSTMQWQADGSLLLYLWKR